VDYGVRSPAFELRRVGRDTVTYCKALRSVRFCIERPIERPVSGLPPSLTPLDERTSIAGLRCRKARYLGPAPMNIWYSEERAVDDPTGAVLQLDGVPGLILQVETIDQSDGASVVRRVTIVDVSFEPPPGELFAQPASHRTVDSVDVARAED